MYTHYTDKKENEIFLIYEEIQNGAVAKSYMTNCLLIYVILYIGKYLRISSYIRKPFLIYDFATIPLWISLYSMYGSRCNQLPLIEKLPQWLSGPSSSLSVTAGPLEGYQTGFKRCSDAQCFIQLLA